MSISLSSLERQRGVSCHTLSLALGAGSPLIAPQRHEREIERIEVVFQIEDLREARPRERLLVPGAVGSLRAGQPVDAGANAVAVLLAGGQQSQQRPGRLRGGRLALAGQ